MVTFGIPVRNEATSIVRCLDSILAQNFDDFEIIVSDNASTDGTPDVVLEYAARDSRIRLACFDENQGIIENFNHVARLARGEYFRWMGADDWIEPSYVSDCVTALERDPRAIAATTYFDLERKPGEYTYTEYPGEFLDSPDAVRRLDRMLWLIREGPGVYEPLYSLIRRRDLLATGLLRMHRKNDWLLAAQLSLAGPFVHIPKRLFHRWWPDDQDRTGNLAEKLHPVRHRELGVSILDLFRSLLVVIDQADLSPTDRRACRRHAALFCARLLPRRIAQRIGRFRRQRLGLTREKFRLR